MKGSYLKHIIISMVLNEPIELANTAELIKDLIKEIDMTITFSKLVHLNPSFEIIYGLKESHCIFSYWKEINFATIDLFSCKNFNIDKVRNKVIKIFPVKKIKMDTIRNCPIFREVELCQET